MASAPFHRAGRPFPLLLPRGLGLAAHPGGRRRRAGDRSPGTVRPQRPVRRRRLHGGGPRGRALRRRQGGTATAGRGDTGRGGDRRVETGQAQPGLTLDTGQLGGADRPAELAVAAAVAGDQVEAIAAVEVEVDADDGADPGRAGRLHEADGAVQAVAVAQSQGFDPQRGGGGHQGARRGRALEEGVVGTGGQLGERGHLPATTELCNYTAVWWSSLAATAHSRTDLRSPLPGGGTAGAQS